MTMVKHKKENPRCEHRLPELFVSRRMWLCHVTQSLPQEQSKCFSRAALMLAESNKRTVRWCLTHRQQTETRVLKNTWLDVHICKFDEINRSSSAHHSTETRRRVADLIPVLMVARIVYISHGECGGHHHSVSAKPLMMSARNSDAHFSGRVGASARFSFEGTRHARSSTA